MRPRRRGRPVPHRSSRAAATAAVTPARPRLAAVATDRPEPLVIAGDFGCSAPGDPGRPAPRVGDHDTLPHPGRDHPRRPGGPGRARPGADRLGQDPGLRPADDHQPGRRSQRAVATRPVVLAPTRELAMQVADVLAPLARTAGLSLVLVAGGMSYPPAAARVRARRRHRGRHPGTADRPDGAGRRRPQPGRDHRARRGRPHGRPRLPAGGDPDPRRGPGRRPAAAVLRDPGRRGRPPGPRLPHRSGHGTRSTRRPPA